MKQPFPVIATGVIATVLMVLFASAWVIDSDPAPVDSGGLPAATATVRSGPFDIRITESAVLNARQSVTLSSELPSNRAKILHLAPEGAHIKKGEEVARFDPSPFEEDIRKLESDINEAEAVLKQARAELSLIEADSETERNKLELAVEAARLRLENLQQAEIPIKTAKAEKELTQTQAVHNRALQALKATETLVEKGLAGSAELEKAREEERDGRIDRDIARRNFDNLTETALPSQLRHAKLALEHSTRELANYDNIVQEQKVLRQTADIARYQSRLSDLQQALAQSHRYLENTTIVAPVSGQLLYKKVSIANEKRRVQVGDSLWNRQGFAVIPDMSSLVAHINVRESDIGKLDRGLRADVFPQAYPGLALTGRVEAIGTLVSGEEETGKFFEVRIALESPDARLRPGMTARATIHARHFKNALTVPVEAVFEINGQTTCFLWRGGDARAVPVEVGASDGESIVVVSGLEPGQEVTLSLPDRYRG